MDQENYCFVIMPFTVKENDLIKYGNDKYHWSEVYEGLILPAVEKAGFVCQRDDEDYRSRLITENIWSKIEKADIVLCDLSANNPNVYLELGWALRADKKFILIKDDLTPFHFDLNQYFTFEYSHRLQPSSIRKSIDELKIVIESTSYSSSKSYSIVNKMSLEKGAIEATKSGNIEIELLKTILDGIKNISTTRQLTQKFTIFPQVLVFYHENGGLTMKDAENIRRKLKDHGLSMEIVEHTNPEPPDAIFISDEANPKLLKLILKELTYVPKYIFPVNHPDSECGALSGFILSIGLDSTHKSGRRPIYQEPYKVTIEELKSLSDESLNDLEFQKRLYEIAPPRK